MECAEYGNMCMKKRETPTDTQTDKIQVLTKNFCMELEWRLTNPKKYTWN